MARVRCGGAGWGTPHSAAGPPVTRSPLSWHGAADLTCPQTGEGTPAFPGTPLHRQPAAGPGDAWERA